MSYLLIIHFMSPFIQYVLVQVDTVVQWAYLVSMVTELLWSA